MPHDAGHPLDNPIWHALGGHHAGFASNTGRVRRYDPQFAPFAAWETTTPEASAALRDAIPGGGVAIMFTTTPVDPPEGLRLDLAGTLLQMLAGERTPYRGGSRLVPLQASDVPAMQALVALTKPGPFAPRTAEMGRYLGVVEAGTLVAMAGERLRPDGFVEVSAVCTHPEHRGKGHAKALVSAVADGIRARGETPFLQVFPDNLAAIKTYTALGFTVRRVIHLTVLTRPATPP
jgi:ribosomal protein S18 acetylase RimI-like enzyme